MKDILSEYLTYRTIQDLTGLQSGYKNIRDTLR